MSSKLLFIFEMANNHMGDTAHGIRIIRELREASAGFDFRFAVKLQYRHLPDLIHPDFRSRSDLKFIKRFTEKALSWDEYRRLKDAIVENGFISICTPFDEASVDRVVEHGFDYLKVASCSLTDWPLAEKIATTSLPLILSTAGEALEEVDRVVSFYQHRNKSFSILHCVGEYPTARRNFQLNQIDLLCRRYSPHAVGYSTHEEPEEVEGLMIAIAKGATLFEKHVAVPTATYPVNAYSATPAQITAWLSAAQRTVEMCGAAGGRHESSSLERATLRELRRGVFAKRAIAAGKTITAEDIFFAIPAGEGQIVANEISKYAEMRATRDFQPNGPVLRGGIDLRDTRSLVHGIVRDVKALLKTSGAVVPTRLGLELSHHYGIERFREVGAAMITVINREYCKRLVLMLPGQWHPEHWHTLKDETFHLLYGEIELVLRGERRQCAVNDLIWIPRGVKHEFRTRTGAVIEEVSSMHLRDDSDYTEPGIRGNTARKTFLTDWMD